MKFILLLLASAIALISTAIHGADYSKCAEYFNNPPDSNEDGFQFRVYRSGPFVPERYRSIPFKLEDDGSITLTDDEASMVPDGVTTTVITYPSPPINILENLEIDEAADIVKHTSADTLGTIVIKRQRPGGPIIEIIEKLPGSTSAQSEYFSSVIGTRTEFEIRNGQCIPTKRVELLERSNGEKTQSITFNTDLCKDIQDLIDENPQVSEVFNTALGKSMNEIFLKYEDNFKTDEARGIKSFFTHEEIMQHTNYTLHRNNDRNDLAVLIFAGYVAGKKLERVDQQSMGLSPLIAAQSIYGKCYYKGLYPFLRDPTLWLE